MKQLSNAEAELKKRVANNKIVFVLRKKFGNIKEFLTYNINE